MSVHQIDERGYLLPWTSDDAVIEAGLDDPDYGPAESWPAWTDLDRFELGPEPAADETGEWPAPYQPTEQDIADLQEFYAEQDARRRTMEAIRGEKLHDARRAIVHLTGLGWRLEAGMASPNDADLLRFAVDDLAAVLLLIPA